MVIFLALLMMRVPEMGLEADKPSQAHLSGIMRGVIGRILVHHRVAA